MDIRALCKPDTWTERSEFWAINYLTQRTGQKCTPREHPPLILCGHGVQMRVEKGSLLIKNGFTHYPQDQEVYRFFRGDLTLPRRIVAVDCDGSISFDVIGWMAEQNVTLLNVNWRGEAVSVLSCDGYAADPVKVQWQAETRSDNDRRMAFACDLIRRKVAHSIGTLKDAFVPSAKRAAAISKAKDALQQLSRSPAKDVAELMGIEGRCAAAYFGALQGFPMKWKSVDRHPVPDQWHTYQSRYSLTTGIKGKPRNASHPLNAMLNYAYGALQNRLQIEAVVAGYDPTIGIMHQGRRQSAAYIFDLMEPERPTTDAAVLVFVAKQTFSGSDFPIGVDGTCRLAPQLARALLREIWSSWPDKVSTRLARMHKLDAE